MPDGSAFNTPEPQLGQAWVDAIVARATKPGAHPNAWKLELFVQGHLDLAAVVAKLEGPEAAARRLNAWAEQVNRHMGALSMPGVLPEHLEGLSAFDLSNARDRLSSAASAYERKTEGFSAALSCPSSSRCSELQAPFFDGKEGR
jgi:hypothetical protein